MAMKLVTGVAMAIGLAGGVDFAAAQESAGVVGKAGRRLPERAAWPLDARGRLPMASRAAVEQANAAGGTSEGVPGISATSSDGERVYRSAWPGDEAGAEAFGTAKMPYTTSRVAVGTVGSPSSTPAQVPVTSYPYRATGKMFMKFGNSTFVCTGSLIGPALLVTAAHCIHNYGDKDAGWADEVSWAPATYGSATSARPYGTYTMKYMAIPSPYYNGTDTCTQTGVVCNNDIAVVVLYPTNGKMPGNVTGWYNYGWNGYSDVVSPPLGNKTVSQISQLGYPVSHDGGYQMQRTDAVGVYFQSGSLKNTHIGSAQTGGSSGGPWIVNLGTPPSVSGASRGQQVTQAVVGVTSWGYTSQGVNQQGASYFGQNKEYPNASYGSWGAGNIGSLVNYVCSQAAYKPSC
jgi:V8-like Glu-specific endopeptidase